VSLQAYSPPDTQAYSPPIYIGLVYHLPKPIYVTSDFIKHLEASMDEISRISPSSLIILAGDLSQLPDSQITEFTGILDYC